MPSRGTMGLRMSRIMVDGLLNNTTYWRIYPSNVVRKSFGVDWNTNSTVYILFDTTTITVPGNYLPGSVARVYRDQSIGTGTQNVYSKIQVNGVDVAGTEHISNTQFPAYDHVYDDISIKTGDVIGVWYKTTNALALAYLANVAVRGNDEGVVDAVGRGAW